jgi:hypothetical protein
MSQRLSLLELNEATCHWPIGDPSSPDFFFCGGRRIHPNPANLFHFSEICNDLILAYAIAVGGRPPNTPKHRQ